MIFVDREAVTKMPREWWVVPGGHRILPISLASCLFFPTLALRPLALSPAAGGRRAEVVVEAGGGHDLCEIGPGVRETMGVPVDHGESVTLRSLSGCLW
jgi:hypothetical protein